jgi:hypothetical protein
LLAPAPLLEAFAGLRFLTFMASGASRHELDDEAKVAEHWARACQTLTIIILPNGRVVCRQVGTFMMLARENRLGSSTAFFCDNLFPGELVPTILTSCNRICAPPSHEQDPERSDGLAEDSRIHDGAPRSRPPPTCRCQDQGQTTSLNTFSQPSSPIRHIVRFASSSP